MALKFTTQQKGASKRLADRAFYRTLGAIQSVFPPAQGDGDDAQRKAAGGKRKGVFGKRRLRELFKSKPA